MMFDLNCNCIYYISEKNEQTLSALYVFAVYGLWILGNSFHF